MYADVISQQEYAVSYARLGVCVVRLLSAQSIFSCLRHFRFGFARCRHSDQWGCSHLVLCLHYFWQWSFNFLVWVMVMGWCRSLKVLHTTIAPYVYCFASRRRWCVAYIEEWANLPPRYSVASPNHASFPSSPPSSSSLHPGPVLWQHLWCQSGSQWSCLFRYSWPFQGPRQRRASTGKSLCHLLRACASY